MSMIKALIWGNIIGHIAVNIILNSHKLHYSAEEIARDNYLKPQWEHYQQEVKDYLFSPLVLIPCTNGYVNEKPPYDNWEEIIKNEYEPKNPSEIEIKIQGESFDF